MGKKFGWIGQEFSRGSKGLSCSLLKKNFTFIEGSTFYDLYFPLFFLFLRLWSLEYSHSSSEDSFTFTLTSPSLLLFLPQLQGEDSSTSLLPSKTRGMSTPGGQDFSFFSSSRMICTAASYCCLLNMVSRSFLQMVSMASSTAPLKQSCRALMANLMSAISSRRKLMKFLLVLLLISLLYIFILRFMAVTKVSPKSEASAWLILILTCARIIKNRTLEFLWVENWSLKAARCLFENFQKRSLRTTQMNFLWELLVDRLYLREASSSCLSGLGAGAAGCGSVGMQPNCKFMVIVSLNVVREQCIIRKMCSQMRIKKWSLRDIRTPLILEHAGPFFSHPASIARYFTSLIRMIQGIFYIVFNQAYVSLPFLWRSGFFGIRTTGMVVVGRAGGKEI